MEAAGPRSQSEQLVSKLPVWRNLVNRPGPKIARNLLQAGQ